MLFAEVYNPGTIGATLFALNHMHEYQTARHNNWQQEYAKWEGQPGDRSFITAFLSTESDLEKAKHEGKSSLDFCREKVTDSSKKEATLALEKRILEMVVDTMRRNGYEGRVTDIQANQAAEVLRTTFLRDWTNRLVTDGNAVTTEYNHYLHPVTQHSIEAGYADILRNMPEKLSDLLEAGRALDKDLYTVSRNQEVEYFLDE